MHHQAEGRLTRRLTSDDDDPDTHPSDKASGSVIVKKPRESISKTRSCSAGHNPFTLRSPFLRRPGARSAQSRHQRLRDYLIRRQCKYVQRLTPTEEHQVRSHYLATCRWQLPWLHHYGVTLATSASAYTYPVANTGIISVKSLNRDGLLGSKLNSNATVTVTATAQSLWARAPEHRRAVVIDRRRVRRAPLRVKTNASRSRHALVDAICCCRRESGTAEKTIFEMI
jgi:hypothetical protein